METGVSKLPARISAAAFRNWSKGVKICRDKSRDRYKPKKTIKATAIINDMYRSSSARSFQSFPGIVFLARKGTSPAAMTIVPLRGDT